MSWIRRHDRGNVRWLTMENAGKRNAVPPGGWETLRQELEDFEASDSRVLVLTGAEGDFCAGAELSGQSVGLVDTHRRLKQVGSVAVALHRLTKPTIAAVDGVAVGAGMNLALGCDVVIATTRARFSEIFVKRGLVPDCGGSWLLPRLVGLQRAKELALSGRIVDATEALRIGLCLEVVEPEDLEARVSAVAANFLDGAPLAQTFIKQSLQGAWDMSFTDVVSWEGQSQSICYQTEDAAEGIASFLEKRPPRFRGR